MEKGTLDEGWFYLTIETVEERTTLAKDAQAGAIKILKDLGWIDTKQRGMPSKRYFMVFEDKIKEMFAERGNSAIKKEETRKQDVGNSDIKKEELSKPVPLDASIYKKPIKETYKNKEPPTPKGVFSFGLHVKLREDEHQVLCLQHTKEVIDSLIDQMNDYISSHGTKGYSDYAATLRNWVRTRQNGRPATASSPGRAPIADQEANKLLAIKIKQKFPSHDIRVQSDYIEFNGGPNSCDHIKYSEHGFKERCFGRLRKWNLNVEGIQ
jgi:hypothetical protein